jgi:hypothetical protein
MTALSKRLVLVVLSGLGLLMVGAYAGREVASAQKAPTIRYTRMFTGPDGLSHFEDLDMKTNKTPTGETTDLLKVQGARFSRSAVGSFSDWHVEAQRQYVISLQGELELEVGGGKKMTFGPGHILLAEDLTGKGHTSRTVGSVDRISIIVPLATQ